MTSGVPVPPGLNVVKAAGGKVAPKGDGKHDEDPFDEGGGEEVEERLFAECTDSQNGRHGMQKGVDRQAHIAIGAEQVR
jgi:hypothetical protein